MEWAISRILSPPQADHDHLSRMAVTRHLLQPTRKLGRAALKRFSIWSCSEWGLPCLSCHHESGELLPHLFTLTPLRRRYIFCGTFLRVTPSSCYEPLCPAEFGLSSDPPLANQRSCTHSNLYSFKNLEVQLFILWYSLPGGK